MFYCCVDCRQLTHQALRCITWQLMLTVRPNCTRRRAGCCLTSGLLSPRTSWHRHNTQKPFSRNPSDLTPYLSGLGGFWHKMPCCQDTLCQKGWVLDMTSVFIVRYNCLMLSKSCDIIDIWWWQYNVCIYYLWEVCLWLLYFKACVRKINSTFSDQFDRKKIYKWLNWCPIILNP